MTQTLITLKIKNAAPDAARNGTKKSGSLPTAYSSSIPKKRRRVNPFPLLIGITAFALTLLLYMPVTVADRGNPWAFGSEWAVAAFIGIVFWWAAPRGKEHRK